MTIYLITFALSIFFYAFAIRLKQKWARAFFLCLSILIPAAVAGLRDLTVGKDLGLYGIKIWDFAVCSESFNSLQSNIHDSESVYLALNYLVSRYTTDIHWFLFIHESVIMTLIVWTALRCKEKFNSEFVLIFMLFYLYCISFNLLRQSIAIVFVLLASTWIFESQIKKSIIPTYLGCLSHNSAFLSVFLYPFKYVVEKFFNKKKLLICLMALFGFICFSFYAVIMQWLMSVGLYSDHYEAYVGQVGFKTHKIDIALIFGLIASLYIFVQKEERNEPFFSYSLCLLVVSLILNLFGSIVEIAVRVAHYFMVALAVVLPQSANYGLGRFRLEYASIVLLIIQFFYLAITTGFDWVIPYKSVLLNW